MERVRLTSKKPSRAEANDEKTGRRPSNGGRKVARVPVPDTIDSPVLAPHDLGAKDKAFFRGITCQLLDAVKNSEEIVDVDLKFAISFIKDFKPRDHIEAALAAQMAIVHLQIMRFAARLGNARDHRELTVLETIFTKLTRTFVAQMDALKRYRATNESPTVLQNVSVQDGGQAIVGHLTQNAAVSLPNKIARAPLGIEHRRREPLPRVGEPEPDQLISPAARRNLNG